MPQIFSTINELGTHRHVLEITDHFSFRPHDQAPFVCNQIALEAPVHPQKTREFQFSLHPERLRHHRLGRLWKSKKAPARKEENCGPTIPKSNSQPTTRLLWYMKPACGCCKQVPCNGSAQEKSFAIALKRGAFQTRKSNQPHKTKITTVKREPSQI